CTCGKVSTESLGNDFTHAQCGARGRVHLVAMMRLDDFDVVAFVQDFRGQLEQPEGQVHADTHVGGHHHRDVDSGGADQLFLLRRKSRGPDHHTHTAAAADLEMPER